MSLNVVGILASRDHPPTMLLFREGYKAKGRGKAGDVYENTEIVRC